MDRRTIERMMAETLAMKEFSDWMVKGFEHRPGFQRNDAGRFHVFLEALKDGRVGSAERLSSYRMNEVQSFVVQNNWAAAFANADDYAGGEFLLPFDQCVFEFRFSERNILLFASQAEGQQATYIPVVNSRDWWFPTHHDTAPMLPVMEQVKAICVALEAGVAIAEATETPTRLNRKRVEKGREPLRPYHIVSLAHRYRGGVGWPVDQGRKRLHFRRGHWRHYEEKTIWIKWTLVGDPDLGFVDKEYRL